MKSDRMKRMITLTGDHIKRLLLYCHHCSTITVKVELICLRPAMFVHDFFLT
jgi:hypothetical protein